MFTLTPSSSRANRGLQQALIRLGVLPCAATTLALTLWFTHEQLDALDTAFNTEGNTMAQQISAISDLSLYAGDIDTLHEIAQSAVNNEHAARVEISSHDNIHVSAGTPANLPQTRAFQAAVRLRSVRDTQNYQAQDYQTQDYQAQGYPRAIAQNDIGSVYVLLDTSSYQSKRLHSMAMGGVIGGIALLLAWLSARNLARAVTQPLQHLSNTVTALTRGNLHARCGNCGKYEITTLAADIDRMAQRLQDSHALNEERVRGATAEALEQLAQAKQATQARTRFLATASHDLRQPVHAMGLFVDTLLPGAAPPQIPSLLRLREATEAMSTMLDTLLYISRLDANVMSPEPKPVLVADLLEQLDAMHAAAAHEAGITLHWLANTKIIMTDHSLALRVLDNLVRNAVLHSAGTRVAIVARRCGNDCVRIEVRDNGVGIASILQNRIFEEFYQVGNQQRDRRNGLGLGLSICARIAQLLGTKITLRSQLHRGSAFALTFPAASPAALSTSTASAATYSAITAHCLLIDNDDAIVEGTTALLTQWGCQVTAARTLEQTLTLLHEQGPYDIVLCDLQLHEHDDGFEIIHHAQQLYPNALTVLISGTTTSDMLQRAQQASVTLLTKPVAPAKLRALLAARKAQ